MGNASLFTIFLSIVATRLGNFGGIYLNTYFDVFGLEGVLSNVMMLVILMQIARYFYTTFYGTYGKEWSPFVFICIVAVVQLLSDLSIYFSVLNSLPDGKNDMIDILKKYAKDNSTNALGAHVLLLCIAALVAMTMKNMSDIQLLIIPAVILFLLPYVLSIVFKKAPPPPAAPPPAAAKETMGDYRGY